MNLSPLIFEPIFKEKVWGGRALERLGKALPAGKNIGESWELADLASTSADGGGGGAERSRIAHGPLRGRTIADAVREWGAELLGSASLTPEGGFPLLVKFLDARENLSVQVHPSPAYAASHAGAHLKTESWYVLASLPGAVIYKGTRAGVTRAGFEAKLRAGASIVEDLIAVPVSAGELHHLPSGTCHALGAGVVVAEVQTPSDTTYRVYDWGRTGRALHIDAALECIAFTPPARVEGVRRPAGAREAELVRTPYYTAREAALGAGESLVLAPAALRRPEVVMCLSGRGEMRAGAGAGAGRGPAGVRPVGAGDNEGFGAVAISQGAMALLPAGLRSVEVQAIEPMTLLLVSISSSMSA